MRFQREAKTLASLNHPNIAAIHGLEESGGVTALVMELVEGDDLSQRIARGAIPLDEALPIAKQIAEALEAAHEQGIIHRDLKPANIKVRDDGTVKMLDFGLAKAIERAAAMSPGSSQSLTITTPALTMAGVILGTAAYMSPEQANGKEADRSADVWAFGCVLYEMLTGRRAFDGDTISEILANVLKTEPAWQRLPAETPDGVRRLLRRSLQKDHKLRFRDIRDARLELADTQSATPEKDDVTGVRSRRGERLAWASALGICRVDRWCAGCAGSQPGARGSGDAPYDHHASNHGCDARDFARWAEGCLRGEIRWPVSTVAAVTRFAHGAAVGRDRGGILSVLVAEQSFHRVLRGRLGQAHESR